MRRKRFRFSLRSAIVCMALIAMLLAIGIRFGGHVRWAAVKAWRPAVTPIPTSMLVAESINEEFGGCEIGPIRIDLPLSMREKFDVQRSPRIGSVNLRFTDGVRTVLVNLTPAKDFVMFPVTGFPDKANFTHVQLYRQIASAKSSDFSFAMSTDELHWHEWLMTNRQYLPDSESIEKNDTPEIQGNLLRFSSATGISYIYEWTTLADKWKGAITFHDPADDPNCIRLATSTFTVNGDLEVFKNATDAELKSLVVPIQTKSGAAK